MKKLLLVPAILFSLVITAITQAPQAALAGGIGNNNIGPSVTFGGGSTAFGIDGKIGVADNISIRPFIAFPSGGSSYGASLTYDWDLRQSSLPITPFIGLGAEFQSVNQTTETTGFAQVGADLNVSDSVALLGAIAVPFSNSNGNSTALTLGAALRF